MKAALSFVFVLLAYAMAGNAHAVDPIIGWKFLAATVYPTPDAACSYWCSLYGNPINTCLFPANALDQTCVTCVGGGGNCANPVRQATCPDGGVPDENNVCQAPDPCIGLDGQTFSAGYYDLGTDPGASPQTTGCDGGCSTDYNGGGVSARQMVGGEYHYFSVGSYVYDGTSCTGGASPSGTVSPPAPSCDPATQDQGTVNGVTVCLDRSNTTEKTKTVEVDPETGEITETTTTTNPDGSTTTETTTTDPATGNSNTTTTTEKAPADSFCSANPTDPSCLPTDDQCAQRPDTVGCSKLGEYSHAIPSSSFTFGFSPETVNMSATCPGDISILGHSLSFATACGAMATIKPIVVGMAAVMAAFLLFGGMRGAD